MLKKNKILIGTRGSQLALWQANWVKNNLIKKYPNLTAELVIIKTKGDKILDTPLSKIDGKGLFIKELEDVLLNRSIDIAVHSMKDMPAIVPKGLCIGSVPKREDPRDVFVCKKDFCIFKTSKVPRIGTSSIRRSVQLLNIRPDTDIVPIRGNLDTRMGKLETQKLDAIVLAAAGLLRLGFKNCIDHYIDTKVMLPAVGQGALCLEIRENDHEIKQITDSIDDFNTRCTVLAERSFLKRLNGGCQVPIAANGILKKGRIVLTGLVASNDGSVVIRKKIVGSIHCPEKTGVKLAELLLSNGADKILQEELY